MENEITVLGLMDLQIIWRERRNMLIAEGHISAAPEPRINYSTNEFGIAPKHSFRQNKKWESLKEWGKRITSFLFYAKPLLSIVWDIIKSLRESGLSKFFSRIFNIDN